MAVPPNWKWANGKYRVPVGDRMLVADDINDGIQLIVRHEVALTLERQADTPPFERFADRWLELCSGKPRTLDQLTHSRKVLVARFGKEPIGAIAASDVAAWLKKRYGEVGVGSANNEAGHLRQIFQLAMDDRAIRANPCDTPTVRNARRSYTPEDTYLPSDEEVDAVIAAADPFLKVAIELDRCTGMRPGELFGLTAPMVLLGAGGAVPLSGVAMLKVEGQLNNKRARGDRTLIASTKRPSSVREVPIASRLQPALLPLLEAARGRRGGLVFVAKRGGPVWDSTASTSLDEAVRRAGVARFTWRSLRHQFISRMLATECDLMTLQAIVGHKKLGTAASTVTVRSYAHRVTSAARTLELIERGLEYTIGTQMAASDTFAQARGYL